MENNTLYFVTTLGSPTAACKNFGICTMDSVHPDWWAFVRPSGPRQVRMQICLEPGDRLRVGILTEGLSPATWHAFFSEGAFRVDAHSILPETLLRPYDLPLHCWIPAGRYPLERASALVGFCLPLRKDTPPASAGLIRSAGLAVSFPQNTYRSPLCS
jgi:hypothetical protein